MKYKFIPVNNDLEKAKAFANSLDIDFIKNNQKIKTKPFYIETLEAVRMLQDYGWKLEGVAEQRNRNRKIDSNYVQLLHPDFSLLNKNGKKDVISSITISNSCDGKKPLEIHLGAFRLVCSNGLLKKDTVEEHKIKHIEVNYLNLNKFILNMNSKTQLMLNEIKSLKERNLTSEEIRNFAFEAAKLRYSKEELEEFDINSLLTVNREEDKGNDVWTVFNRIQESLTCDISNLETDININKKLYSLTEQFV